MNILLNGASGRMGIEVATCARNQPNLKIVCGFDREERQEGEFPIYNKIENIKEKIDVIIDFSVPVATFEILKYAKKNKVPVVIATTGFNEEELKQIEELSKEIPIFKSSNMSLEINLMSTLVQKVAEVLKESDIEIIETHHNRKIDSPSGTAILLADAINKVFDGEKEYNFLNYHAKTGWFGFDLSLLGWETLGIGVFYNILFLTIIFILIGLLFIWIKNRRKNVRCMFARDRWNDATSIPTFNISFS